ncbi:MAG TPA: hypothetical protein VIK78_09840 [Ruminiclostridium sp.]
MELETYSKHITLFTNDAELDMNRDMAAYGKSIIEFVKSLKNNE